MSGVVTECFMRTGSGIISLSWTAVASVARCRDGSTGRPFGPRVTCSSGSESGVAARAGTTTQTSQFLTEREKALVGHDVGGGPVLTHQTVRVLVLLHLVLWGQAEKIAILWTLFRRQSQSQSPGRQSLIQGEQLTRGRCITTLQIQTILNH